MSKLAFIKKLCVSFFGGWFGLASVGFLPMAAIFMIPGNGSEEDYAILNVIMWTAFILAPALFVIHVWGQIRYWKAEEGQSNTLSLFFIFSAPIFVIIFLSLAFVMASELGGGA